MSEAPIPVSIADQNSTPEPMRQLALEPAQNLTSTPDPTPTASPKPRARWRRRNSQPSAAQQRRRRDRPSRRRRKTSSLDRATRPAIERAEQPRVSAIIPTLNEAANLPHVFARIPADVHEIIIVDGLSTDDTVTVARMLRPDVRVVLQNRRGKGNALACGFAAATGEIIVMLDADGSTDPSEIPSFIEPLLLGADFVKGSRYMSGGGSSDITRVRGYGNRALNLTVNTLFRTQFTDLCYGYSAFWRDCLPHLHIDCDGFEVETMLNVRAAKRGFAIVEVPSFEQDRINGASNLNAWRDGKRVLKTIAKERVGRLPEPSDRWRPQFAELEPDGGEPQILEKAA